jgi:hypothetical protein
MMSAPTFHEEITAFGHIEYHADEHLLAVVNAAGMLLVGENPYLADHPYHAATDAYLARLDGGTPAAVDQRQPRPVLECRLYQWDTLRWPEDGTSAPTPGVARVLALDWRGKLLCEARTADECWPGAPGTPLGQRGYWWGTAADLVWLGDTEAALDAAIRNLRGGQEPVTALPRSEVVGSSPAALHFAVDEPDWGERWPPPSPRRARRARGRTVRDRARRVPAPRLRV